MATRPSFPHPAALRLCLTALTLTFSLASAAPAAPSPTPHPTATPTPAPSATPTPSATPSPAPGLALAEIAPQAQAALNTLKGIESADTDPNVKATQAVLLTLSKNIDDLREQSSRATASVGSPLDTLRNLQIGWQRLERELTDRSEALGERGRALEAEAAQVAKLNDFWTATKTAAETRDGKEVAAPAETLERVREVLYNALLTRTRVEARQNAVVDLQNRVGALLARTSAGQESVNQALAAAVKTLFIRESAPLWTPEAQSTPGLATRWRDSLAEQTAQVQSFAAAHEELFAVHAGVFAALFALLWWLRRAVRRWTADEPHLHRAAPIFRVPGATALLLSFFVMGQHYQGAPGLVHAAVGVLALLPTVFLLRRLLAPRLYLVLYSLVGFTLVDQFRLAAGSFPAFTRWLFCGEMLAAIGVFLWLLRMQRGGPPASRVALGRWLPALCGLAVAAFAGALLAAVAGYVRLGTLAGTATLQSGYVAVFLYALLRVLDGLTVIALRVRPVSASRIAQTHRDQVQAQVYNVCRAGAVALWLKVTLEHFQLFTPLYAALARVLGTRLPLGSHGVSLGQLLGFAAAIWLSTLVSRVVRFFLSEEIYERVNLAPGLPYAISTMVNYGVLLVGFVIALSVLDVDLTKVTIVAGAFSVGLGFGLQNIINNFVSGVILLFERPIKVGDVIQIGDSVGEVRRIGIRASIVRTRDGSDVILPNGGLISGQVTNWTYADRSRAVEIPLTVAAGPDPARVVALLQAAAEREPAAENRPAPQVYVTALTATGFSVVVRAWTSHYEDWIEVRSELALALNAALVREGVKLAS